MMEDSNSRAQPRKRRAPFRFSLRTAVAVLTVSCILFAIHISSVKRQQSIIQQIQLYGGWVYYDYELLDERFDPQARSVFPQWLLENLGTDHFHSIAEVGLKASRQGYSLRDDQRDMNRLLGSLASLKRLQQVTIDVPLNDQTLYMLGRLRSLQRLRIRTCVQVGDESIWQLGNLRRLKSLSISQADFSDSSLAFARNLKHFEHLTIRQNGKPFSDQVLLQLQGNTQLRTLELPNLSQVTDRGLVYLKRLTALESLCLDYSQVTEQGLRELVHLKKLTDLSLVYSKVKDTRWLEDRLPNCQVNLAKNYSGVRLTR